MKLLGSLFVFAGFGYGWHLCRSRRKRELTARTGLISALRRMQEEICSRQTPIPRLAEMLAAEENGDVQTMFLAFLEHLQAEGSIEKAWTAAVGGLVLPQPEKNLVQRLGKSLSKEEATVIKELGFTVKELDVKRKTAEKKQNEREKQASALWFSAAALLVIILL